MRIDPQSYPPYTKVDPPSATSPLAGRTHLLPPRTFGVAVMLPPITERPTSTVLQGRIAKGPPKTQS